MTVATAAVIGVVNTLMRVVIAACINGTPVDVDTARVKMVVPPTSTDASGGDDERQEKDHEQSGERGPPPTYHEGA